MKKIVVQIIIFLLSLIEIPVFLLKNRDIFKNKIVYVFWTWSFGHTITGLDYAARLFFPHRISLVFVPHIRSNDYLAQCFSRNVDDFIFHSIILSYHPEAGFVRYRLLRFVFLIISGIFDKFQVIEQLNIYKIGTLAHDTLSIGNETAAKIEKYGDLTGYDRLLRDKMGVEPCLPPHLYKQCKEAVEKSHPDFFKKPFVILLLRKKGMNNADFVDRIRNSAPQENYLPAVSYLIESGYQVVGDGETDHSVFSSLSGYYSFENVDAPRKLLNVFLLMHSALFVGQHSGPYILASSCGIRVLLCDVLPHWQGTFCSSDIILFKNLKLAGKERFLTLKEIYKEYVDIANGFNYQKKNIVIEPNNSEQILESVKEMVAIMHDQQNLSGEDKALIDAFKALPGKNMRLYYNGNRVPLYILRKEKNGLLS